MKAAKQRKVAAAQKVASAARPALASGQALSELKWNEWAGIVLWAMVPFAFAWAIFQKLN